MSDYTSEIAQRGRFLLFLVKVAAGSSAFTVLLASLWHTWGPLAAAAPMVLWLYLARGWVAFALFVAVDVVWFAATRRVVLLPQLDRVADRNERDRKYFKTGTNRERRTGPRWASKLTAFTNPFTPILFLLAGFLARCPEAEGASKVGLGGPVPGRDVFTDWHRISGHRAPA